VGEEERVAGGATGDEPAGDERGGGNGVGERALQDATLP
jgi:hypothetical protein